MRGEEEEEGQLDESSTSEKNDFKVGKLKKDIWSNSRENTEQEVCGEQVKLRGARKIAKGRTERTGAHLVV